MRGLSATHVLCLCQASALNSEASLYNTSNKTSALIRLWPVASHERARTLADVACAHGIAAAHIGILDGTLSALL